MDKMNFKKLSIKVDTPESNTLTDINLGNVDIFDDVWIEENGNIYDGWVFAKNCDYITIIYSKKQGVHEASFKIERPLDRTKITQNNKTLILKRDDV